MRTRVLLAMVAMLLPYSIAADVIAYSERVGVAIASRNAILGVSVDGATRWRASGVANPAFAIVSDDGSVAAVIDSLDNKVAIVDLQTGSSATHDVPETPIAAEFIGVQLFVLSRDARKLTRIGQGATMSIDLASDPAFLRARRGRLFVYSRVGGVFSEITIDLRLQRTLSIPPFASDFEVDDQYAYFVYPRASRLVVLSTSTFKVVDQISVGATPVDLTLERQPNAISAGTIAVADPSSRRLWRLSRSESGAATFGRSFLRGFLGLGVSRQASTEFPTGVDRVWTSRPKSFGYDSASRTLYRIEGKSARLVAKDIAPTEFVITPTDAVAWIDNSLVHLE